MQFFLGTHEPTWLNRSHVPLFVSAVRLAGRCRVKLPRARCPWALDSGGFSVLSKHGAYPWSAAEYAGMVRRWRDRIGLLEWAAVQDWMCEPEMIARTGLTVEEHQRRTVASWVELRAVAPDLPWVPVLQGWTRADYLRCVELYAAAGTDLTRLPVVGIGSVCRRQGTAEAERVVRELAGRGIRLHGFGFKLDGIERCRDVLASADSLAWSDGARKRQRDPARLTPPLFEGADRPAVASPQNNSRTALAWLDDVRQRAGITDEEGQTVCPFCASLDVHPPGSSETDYCCVECGESFGDVLQPTLEGGPGYAP